MRLFGRRSAHGDGATATVEPPDAPLDLLALRARIDELHEAIREHQDTAAERELLALRNRAGLAELRAAAAGVGGIRFPDPAPVPARDGVAETTPGELTPQRLRGAILSSGCLLVRGLVDRERALRFADAIDRAFAERDRHDEGQPHDDGYYSEFEPEGEHGNELPRPWIKQGGGVLAVDSPHLSLEMASMFRDAGLPELVSAYLGEPALVSADKTTLRKALPTVPGAWHQDGKFMGPVRSLNLWLSLSRCGDVAPGLDIVPRRLEQHVAPITGEATLGFVVSQQDAERAAGERGILRPIFEPGDALLFDELFLHQTASDPAMPNPRYAIENWFFGASGFPAAYAPLTV